MLTPLNIKVLGALSIRPSEGRGEKNSKLFDTGFNLVECNREIDEHEVKHEEC